MVGKFLCFLALLLCVSCNVHWQVRVNEVVDRGDDLWGFYGLHGQVALQRNSHRAGSQVCEPAACSSFETQANQDVVIISAQCESCTYPNVALRVKNIENSSLRLVPLPDHEVVMIVVEKFKNEQDTIRFVASELCAADVFDGPCEKIGSLALDSYVWHVAKKMEPIQSIESYNRLEHLTEMFRNTQIAEEDPIVSLLEQVSEASQRQFLESLTSVHTRLSTAGSVTLQSSFYLLGLLQGFGLEPVLYYYDTEYPPDVCADIPGTLEPEKLVVVGAHYDDRAADIQNTTVRAPGANDDGSGCALLQEMAKILSSSEYSFRYTIRVCFWAGEEQGLVGSSAYAAALRANDTTVIGMLQADMVGYLTPGKPYGVDMASRETDSALTALANQITAAYVPELVVGSTTSCCTDSASFTREGYAAAAYNEPGGYTIDPQ